MTPTVVVVPTFNEADTILHTIEEINSWLPDADILIVDDDSPDGTGDIVDQRSKLDPRVRALHRPAKEGLGAAYRAGFEQVIPDYDVIIQMDADGSHPASALPELRNALDAAGLVLGSRWVSGGQTKGWPLHRLLLSRAASGYARTLLHSPVRDMTAGFRAFRADTLRAIDVATTTTNGYGFQIETLHRTERAGISVIEIPITFSDRAAGTSKMSSSVIREAASAVWQWRRQGSSFQCP